MRFIKGKTQRYLLKDETPKECDVGDYFLKEVDRFFVSLCYNNGIGIQTIAKYTKEYSKKVSVERLEQLVRDFYD